MISAKEARKITKKNNQNNQISALIEYNASNGYKSLSTGWFGHDAKIDLTEKQIKTLKRNGYKITHVTNSNNLHLHHIISWL